MKVVIEGQGFDTDKALYQWPLIWRDRQGDSHQGHAYQASSGIFYFYAPTEKSYEPKWQMTGEPTVFLTLCGEYLTQEDQVKIADNAGLDWQ